MNTLNAAMNSMKDKGFINYYGGLSLEREPFTHLDQST